MLITYQINIAIGQGLIRCNIIRKFYDFNFYALFFCFLGNRFYDFRMRTCCCADFNFFIRLSSKLTAFLARLNTSKLTAANGNTYFLKFIPYSPSNKLFITYKNAICRKQMAQYGAIYVSITHLPGIPVGIGTFLFSEGCRSFIGPVPQLLLMMDKSNSLL